MSRSYEISNSDDQINLQDLLDRIVYLEDERNDFANEHDLDEYPGFDINNNWKKWDESSEGIELHELEEVAKQIDDYILRDASSYQLIRDSYFETYTQAYAEEISETSVDFSQWPYCYIDWQEASNDLQSETTSLEFDRITYWLR
jgi:hypothetical protein